MPQPDLQIIAFYNLENFFDTVDDPVTDDDDFLPDTPKKWTGERYDAKLAHISESIYALDRESRPVIIGVSEIENKAVLRDLVHQAPFQGEYAYIHHDSPDKRGIDVALIYHEPGFRVLSDKRISVTLEGEPGYVTRDILYVNGIMHGRDVVHFFVNHWPSRREGTLKSMPRRIAAAKCLYREVRMILDAEPMAKIVLMGDFNDLPVSKSITAYLHAKPYRHIKNGQFFNLAHLPYRQKKGSVFAKNRWLMFDQILISKGMITGNGININASGLEIHFDKRLMFYDRRRKIYRPNRTYAGNKYHGGYSDHLPVYVKIEHN